MSGTQSISLIALLAFAVTAGCGSDEASEATTTSKAEFARRADLICTKAANEQGEIATDYLGEHPNAKEVDLVEPAIVPPLEQALKELNQLGLPEGAESKAEAFVEEFEAGLEAIKQEPAAALSEQESPFNEANSLATELRLGDCSRNP